MTVGAGDALFGQDGTAGGVTGPVTPDGVGPLPRVELPLVRMPMIGPDGRITGLDESDADLEAAASAEDGETAAPAAVSRPGDGVEPAAPPVPPPVPAVPPERGHAAGARADPPASAGPGSAAAPRTAAPVPPAPGPGSRPTHRPAPARPDARPRVVDEPGILGLSRRSRSRLGSRLFTWFFVFVFAVILVQMVVALLGA